MSGPVWWVALSGGVDSAVAAAVLREGGAQVVGVTLDLGLGGEAIASARCVADAIGIEHRVIDVRERFAEAVVEPFALAYAAGETPNPCVLCNEQVKLGLLLPAAMEAGAAGLASGHYARIVGPPGDRRIARAAHARKDQSYFLYRLTPEVLEHVAFPLGELSKAEVRERARELGLPVAERAESQDVCFLAGTTAGRFVSARGVGGHEPGPVLDLEGRVIGEHTGICHYTPGQRKGLPGGAGPLFVVAIDPARNAVVAGPREACDVSGVYLADELWHGSPDDVEAVCVRANAPAVRCRVVRSERLTRLELEHPVCAAPGQAAVCYRGDVVIGGGTIVRERST